MQTALARPTLAASFVLMSLLGAGVVFVDWASSDIAQAWLRASLFVAAMAAAHVIGYRLYVGQKAPRAAPAAGADSTADVNLPMIVVKQLPWIVLSALVLDGGRAFRICLIASLGHWLAVSLIVLRPHRPLTGFDSFIVRRGFFVCLAVAIFFAIAKG